MSKPSLDYCLRKLEKPSMRGKISTECYTLLQFPNRPGNLNLVSNLSHFKYFQGLIPNKKITITKTIKVLDRNGITLNVPYSLEKELKTKVGFTITPITYDSNIYGLLQDARFGIWQLFHLPGSKVIDDAQHSQLEQKISSLLSQKFKRKLNLFYGFISYKPDEGTFDSYWWSSWIAYLAIKIAGQERELLVNRALASVLKDDVEYKRFVTGFNQMIKGNK